MLPNTTYFETPPAALFSVSYLGRRDSITNVGDFFVPPWQPGVVIVLLEDGPVTLVNVCPHRQALLLTGRGNTGKILCQMHGWKWDRNGKNPHCPGFSSGKELMKIDMEVKGGWMFARNSDIANAIHSCPPLSFENYRLIESNTFTYDCSWMEYVDVYLDVNHVKYIHPALRSWIDCSKTRIELGENWSLHEAPFKAIKPVGLAGLWWQKMSEKEPDAGSQWVRWMHIFPNILVENYGGFFIGVAIVVPKGNSIIVYEEVWARPDLAEDTDLCDAFSRMFIEIEKEDAELLMATRRGREGLYSMGLEDSGPYQKPTEEAMEHFHRWITEQKIP